MTAETHQSTGLKVHLDANTNLIWYVGDTLEAKCVGANPKTFVEHMAGCVEVVQLLGFRSNAELICRLYEVCQERESPPRILIGTPDVCTQRDCRSAATVLQRMDAVGLRRPSQGGWHALTSHDFTSYLLICELAKNKKRLITPEVMEVVRQHPAYPALSFLPTIDWYCTASVLGLIADPRWYVDPSNPDRGAKLRAYLGLTKRNARAYVLGQGAAGMNYDRAAQVFYAWWALDSPNDNASLPANFLIRRAGRFADQSMGVLRATRCFLEFLRHYWIAVVGSHPELLAVDCLLGGVDSEYRDAAVEQLKLHLLRYRTI